MYSYQEISRVGGRSNLTFNVNGMEVTQAVGGPPLTPRKRANDVVELQTGGQGQRGVIRPMEGFRVYKCNVCEE